MKIFGIGLPHTGTRSLTIAMSRLGFKAAHGPEEHAHAAQLLNAIIHGATDPIVITRYDYIDHMTNQYRWLDDAYPGARFICTQRDVDAWIASVRRRWRAEKWTSMAMERMLSWHIAYRLQVFGCVKFNEHRFRLVHHQHAVDVARHFRLRFKVRRGKLVIPTSYKFLPFSVVDGWEPLCKWLELPIPDEPFPYHRVGARSYFRQKHAAELNAKRTD